MNTSRSAQEILESELLSLRAKILELAAGLDRIDRGEHPAPPATTMKTLSTAIETLLRPGPHRAEQVQLLFSRAYQEDWREKMEM